MLQNCYLRNCFLWFLHRPQKISFLTKTLMDGQRMFIYIPEIFGSIFCFFKYIKIYFHNSCICSYEPKHHVLLLYILSFFQVLKGPPQSMNYFRATCYRFAKWSVICCPKDQSGLGIHDFEAKNTALHNGHLNFLPKMGWEPETGCSLVLIYWFINPLAGPLESLFGWVNEGKPILLQIYNLNL
jgi:hypothetical protein